MVSIAGFAIGELIVAVITAYVLIVVMALLDAVKALLDDELEGVKWKLIVQYVGLLGVMVVVMWMDIRIGTVMFINGFIAAVLVVKVRHVWGSVYAAVKG